MTGDDGSVSFANRALSFERSPDRMSGLESRESAMAAKLRVVLIAAAALGAAALLATAAAQPYGPGAGMMGPGMMSGSGMMMGRRGFGAMCNPAASGFAEWRAERIAELVKLTD